MNKKPLVGILVIALMGVIGITYAVFTNVVSISNIFGTRYYHTEVTEEFVSPDNWLPGTTTEKKVYVENTGNVDVLVRVKYDEKWISANGKELPLMQGENVAAIINFANSEDWILDGEYYYYQKTLLPGEKTTSFIDSVTFNQKITSDYLCDGDGNKKTCLSTGDGYDGATYTLTITIETIQETAKGTLWGIENPEIEEPNEEDIEDNSDIHS